MNYIKLPKNREEPAIWGGDEEEVAAEPRYDGIGYRENPHFQAI
jgi:hypothetical protein